MDWQEEYKRKLTTPEEAVKIVKSGDRVAIGGSIDEPEILPDALYLPESVLRARVYGPPHSIHALGCECQPKSHPP